MITKVEDSKSNIVAILCSPANSKATRREWITEGEHSLQVANYTQQLAGTEFKAHKHITRTRSSNITQEAIVVMSGILEVDIFDDANRSLGKFTLRSGDLVVTLSGGHGYKVIKEGTSFYEFKSGPYAEPDKELL